MSSNALSSSKSISFNRSDNATVREELIEKSVTSASIDTLSGMSISSVLSSLLLSSSSVERESVSSFKLSLRPGIPTPTTIFLLPSEITFPLSMVTLENVSSGSIIAVSITNGL